MADPYKSPEVAAPNHPAIRSIFNLHAAAWLYPAVLVAAFYGTWLVAWAFLGHMPRPSLDDPKQIGIVVDIPYVLSGLLLVSFPAAAVAGIVVQLSAPARTLPKQLVGAALLVAVWVAAILLLRWDPLHVVEWFMD